MTDIDDRSAAPRQGPSPRRRGGRALVIAIAVVVVSPLIAFAGLMGYYALAGGDPASYAAEGFEAYASVASAGAFARDIVDLEALDAILSPPAYGAARQLVRTMRSQSFVRSEAYARLSGIRVDAALYPDGNYLIASSLGYRAALVRVAPLALRLVPRLASRLPGLVVEGSAASPRFSLSLGDSSLSAVLRKDVLLIASSDELLSRAAGERRSGTALAAALAQVDSRQGSLRLLTDPAALLATRGPAGEGLASSLLTGLSFPALAAIDLRLSGDRIGLSVDLPFGAEGSPLAPLLARRSPTPAALSRLPESTVYYSLLSAGRPGELWAALRPVLGAEAEASYAKADRASALALGLGLEELLFSWMGAELGVLGSSRGAEQVFFVSIADEKARRSVFDKAFSSLVVGRDVSALVAGQRVPRAVFPGFLRTLLEALGIRLAEPFYLVEDGFLFASQSAELLAACVGELREGRLLVKTERWQEAARGVSPESAASIFYSLDRSVPFFMRGSSGLEAALRLYGRGLASLRLDGARLRLELSALSSGAAGSGPRPLPGFPVAAEGRMSSDPAVARAASGAPMAYWTSGSAVVGLDLSSGARFRTELDDAASLALDVRNGTLEAVWAVSDRGTVYRLSRELSSLPGFPLVTGQRASGPSVALRDESVVAVPISEGPSLMLVASDGSTRFSVALPARVRSRPASGSGVLAALPRSFDSWLFALAPDGTTLPGWPAALPGLASASPGLASEETELFAYAATEAGELCAFARDGSVLDGFPVILDASFDAAPAWSSSWRSLYAVSVEGSLFRIGSDGSRLGRLELSRGGARGSALRIFDANGDGREELYVAGGGDALYAYSGELEPLPGFPVSGSGRPEFIDINGDGVLDLVTRGADDTLWAYTGL